MCGIAGFFSKNSSKDKIFKTLSIMNKEQIHRGPNSFNSFINNDKNFGMIMCRLSILDLELGIQPMSTKDKRYTIIFNGTILNSPELRKNLEESGVKFFTNNSDTEVLLNMLIKYGKKSLDKLNGSFAFAFYDEKKKIILCARDRFGLAPFYYLWKNSEFLFASELKSILATGMNSMELNKKSINDYLSLLWVPGPNTIFKDIKKLPAGELLEIDFNNRKINKEKWWDIEILGDSHIKESELFDELFQALENSVVRSTLSDVPLACGLSGGLDSQSIAGLLNKNNFNTNSFTLAFEGYDAGNLNELEVSRLAAKSFKTNHHEMILNVKDYFQDLNKMIYHLDEPYGGGLPLWHVLKEAGKKFGVILTGLGGDELFGNFGRWTLLEKTKYDFFKNKFQFETLFFNRKYFFTEKTKAKLLNEKHDSNTMDFFLEIMSKKSDYNIRDKIMYLDLKTQLQDEYCNMVNKFSMANQIEARAPFLDNEFTEKMFRVPASIRTSKTDFKYLLRRLMKKIIPKENLNNRKRGFIGLESQILNYNFNEIKSNLFNEKKIKKQDIFNNKFLKEFVESFQNNNEYVERGFFSKKYSYKSLWSLIMFQKWYDIFVSKEDNFEFKLD